VFSGETSRRAVVYEIILDVVARNSTDLYKRKGAQVSLFTGIVAVGMTINIIKLILLTQRPMVSKSSSIPNWRADLGLGVRSDVPRETLDG
jgi:hypothetical protein